MQVELTAQEAQAIIDMSDVALKHDTLGGIRFAMMASIIREKLGAAARPEPPVKEGN